MNNTINQTEVDLLKTFAECWNTLDWIKLEPLLAEEVMYDSQWVTEFIHGKRAFLVYFSGKLETLKGSVTQTQVNAEPRMVINYFDFTRKPCLEITQRTHQETRQFHLLIEVLNGKIVKIDICFVPCHFIVFPEN